MALRLDEGDTELSEINVTPFIDVILVLLIVFMVAAPLSTVDVPVDLPGSSAPVSQRPEEPLWLTLTVDLDLMLDDSAVAREALGAALDAKTGGKRDTPVFLRADRKVDYGALMQALNRLRDAGYLKVALVGLEDAP
ncbi:TonB system transport protein ExbD [Tabrizicola sp.]|jgi:TonB system transport protein ExbD (group 1)|uniref:TonB system transport protein ExbD n=1 Tax=Tabrizicola sp. TaxID=2005166 RepID=UPI001A61068B|nr:TonB system transport protein ExbD [Tabrizicola sp.]MBL9075060.1 TonB system transport protein ExbD [Tabrizicola sp.]